MLKERLDAVMEKLRGEEAMAAVREFANRNFNFILDRAKEAIPRIKETDLNFIALIKAGFTVRAVCLLQDMKPSTFYSKRDRLEKKLRNLGITL